MGFNKLSTKRLSLQLITEDDFQNIHTLHSFPEVDRYNTLGIPTTLDETISTMMPFVKANLTGEKYTYGIYLTETKTFIGLIGITVGRAKYQSAEVWFKYMPHSWGNGYATEVLKHIIDFCFNELKLHRIEAGCAVDNMASAKVMEKVGMKREGRRRKTLPLATGWSDNFEYAILDTDQNGE